MSTSTTASLSEDETLRREILTLKDRVRTLERLLEAAGDTNYDLKQKLRQMTVVNEELRSLQGSR